MERIVSFKELPLSDNFMFGAVMSDPEVCKPFLEAVLQKKIVRIQFVHKEEAITNYPGLHGVRLDVYVIDENGTRYDIEMQNGSSNALHLERRARFYQSSIDRNFLKSGEEYEKLPQSYIIFVCNFDYFKAGYTSYERVCRFKDCSEIEYSDGTHVIFFNTYYKTANVCKDIQEFLDYIRTNDDALPLESELAKKARDKVQDVRNDEKMEVEYMTMQMYLRDKYNEGKIETLKSNIRSIADLISPEEIAKRFNVSLEFVRKVLSSSDSQDA